MKALFSTGLYVTLLRYHDSPARIGLITEVIERPRASVPLKAKHSIAIPSLAEPWYAVRLLDKYWWPVGRAGNIPQSRLRRVRKVPDWVEPGLSVSKVKQQFL